VLKQTELDISFVDFSTFAGGIKRHSAHCGTNRAQDTACNYAKSKGNNGTPGGIRGRAVLPCAAKRSLAANPRPSGSKPAEQIV